MTRKIFMAALFLAILPLTSYSAYADDAKPAPGDNTSPQSVKASYFQGIWSGSWPGFYSPTASQDVTINIGQETREKIFDVTYSWGAVTWLRGNVPAGNIRTEGREQDDEFHFQWENKQGRKIEVMLQKNKDNMVKARIEKSGPSGPRERPVNETFLYRK